MAITEGVFLRGTERWAAAARRPDGAVEVVTGPLPTWYRQWAGVPFARGIVALAESLTVGIRALLWSTAVQRGATSRLPHPNRVRPGQLAANLAPALVLAIALFFVGPAAVAHWLAPWSSVGASVLETVLRIALVIVYLVVVGRIAEVRRVFQHHGAEHKVVALHESGAPPTVAAARRQPSAHPRCGTTFFVIVVFVSALAHTGLSVLGSAPLGLLLSGRALLVPLAAAAAYEVLLLVERAPDRSALRALLKPGLLLQSLTVLEPDDGQLEVALAALAAATAPAEGVVLAAATA